MFLLFSAVGGAGGALLDEAESGTLERLLSTNIGMTGLLAGKWLFLTLIGTAQLTVMFLWGRVAFGLPLFAHIPGFLVMTVVTAGAAAALGLVLATLARSRAQLSGFSTILILTMSALGGSMFPRFLMSETMQKIGLVTFNAWALDGYLKVFWRNAAVWELWPQVLVLVAARLHVLRDCPYPGPPLGARVIAARATLMLLAAVAGGAGLTGCRNIDVITESYASLAEAQAAGAVDRGWLPKGLPPGTRELRVAHDLDSNRRWGLFNFPPAEGDALRRQIGAELSVRRPVLPSPAPHRVVAGPAPRAARARTDQGHRAAGLRGEGNRSNLRCELGAGAGVLLVARVSPATVGELPRRRRVIRSTTYELPADFA